MATGAAAAEESARRAIAAVVSFERLRPSIANDLQGQSTPSPANAPVKREGCKPARLKDVAAQVLVLDQCAQVVVDVAGIDQVVLAVLVGRFVGNRVEQPLEHGVQASRADIFGALVY